MFYIATGIINHTTDQITRTFSNEYPNAMKFAPTGRACAASSIVMMPNYLENKSCANKSRYHIGYVNAIFFILLLIRACCLRCRRRRLN